MSAVNVLAAARRAVLDARTAYAHARQNCVTGTGSQAEYESARAALADAKAALARIGGAV